MDKIEKTEENLQKALNEHVCYEILMFYYCIDMITGKIEWNFDRLRMNTLIESFAIHTRNLLKFFYFYGGNRKKNEVVVLDYQEYINREKWEKIKNLIVPEKEKRENINKIWNRLNDEITHISIKRVDIEPEKKVWDYYQINEMDVLITSFLLKFFSLIKEDILGEDMLQEKQRVIERRESLKNNNANDNSGFSGASTCTF